MAEMPDPWLERLAEEESPEMQILPIPKSLVDFGKFIDEVNRRMWESFGIRSFNG